VRERVRSFLGVYAPMIVGLLLIGLAVNFLLASPAAATSPWFVLDPLSSAMCGGIVILVGCILILSTMGRWRKVRRTRHADADRRQKNV